MVKTMATAPRAGRRGRIVTAAVWFFALPNLIVTTPSISGVARDANSSLAFDVTTIAKA